MLQAVVLKVRYRPRLAPDGPRTNHSSRRLASEMESDHLVEVASIPRSDGPAALPDSTLRVKSPAAAQVAAAQICP